MNTYLKALLMGAAVAGLYVPATAHADFRDYNYKAWAQTGRQRMSQSARRSRPIYRSTAPVIVRTGPMFRSTAPVIVRSAPAPTSVAQAPTEQRSFSYEPSPQAETSVGRETIVSSEPVPATQQRPTRTYRSFSYEPSIGGSYSVPRMQSSRPSRSSATPRFLLPKTDPRKYRN